MFLSQVTLCLLFSRHKVKHNQAVRCMYVGHPVLIIVIINKKLFSYNDERATIYAMTREVYTGSEDKVNPVNSHCFLDV